MYKLGLWIVVQKLKKIPTIESIYLKTKFNDYFTVGQSDLDLHVVLKEVEVNKEIKAMETTNQAIDKIIKIFPFINEMQIYPHTNFNGIISRTPRGFYDPFTLIYGKKLDLNYSENLFDHMFAANFYYSDLLFTTYESTLNGDGTLRIPYKLFYKITRILYSLENKKYTSDKKKLKTFLKDKGIPENFINTIYNLPNVQYKWDRELLIQILFNTIKLIETSYKQNKDEYNKNTKLLTLKKRREKYENTNNEILEFVNNLDKQHVKSIYLFPKSAVYNATCLITVIPSSLNYSDFKKQISSILNNLHSLKSLKQVANAKVNMFTDAMRITDFTMPLITTTTTLKIPGVKNGFQLNNRLIYNKLFGEVTKEFDFYEEHKRYYEFQSGYTIAVFLLANIKNQSPKERESYLRSMKRAKLILEKGLLVHTRNIDKTYEKEFGKTDKVNFEDYKDVYTNIRKLMPDVYNQI
ncbi:hypothetical protein CL614_08830 [archaeon]|nr:hypothetical protein [archaeon]